MNRSKLFKWYHVVCVYIYLYNCGNGSAMHSMSLKTILLVHDIFSLAAEKRDQKTHQTHETT